MVSDYNQQDLHKMGDYLRAVPYYIGRKALYSASELDDGFDLYDDTSYPLSYDGRVYHHYLEEGIRSDNVFESFGRTLHDHGIHSALNDFFKTHDHLLCVGVMGGHALLRTDPMYRNIAEISKRLTQLGFYMLSGGGPGAMEATHLGAWMAGFHDDELHDALKMLSVAPTYQDRGWLSSAFKVMDKYPQNKYESLGIPTWLYGHEPSTPFATHIAKFFENSIREDSILTLAYGGIIYTPGSAGTMQEIFQDAVQNHYLSFGFSSPMIFLGTKFWTEEMPAFHLLNWLVKQGKYKNLRLSLTDESDDIIYQLIKFQHEANVYPDMFELK